ncbi:hypothetical protein WJX72_004532 [[Myrmecia] bisecta]|uniref:Amidase domain-containing protein n=1 Tax=[Myrmecia] bisecta TaxID=41462 RepID=A0AAW1R650_9CHLO
MRSVLVVLALALCTGCSYATGSSRALLQSAPAPTLNPADLASLSAVEANKLLCSRQITTVQYVTALLAQKAEWDCINAWADSFNATLVLADAKAIDDKATAGGDIGPLCGLPLGVKDSIDALPYPTTAGTPALRNAVPPFEAPLVTQWRKQNGIIMGKTKLHELSGGSTCASPAFGAVLNPYLPTRIVGGSSGGTGAALAARMVPGSLCEDTAGSCRHPAALTGGVGIRPSLNCYNFSDSLVPASFTRDTVGVQARTIEDLILFDAALRSPNATTAVTGNSCAAPVDMNLSLQGVRIGMPMYYYNVSEQALKPYWDKALAVLTNAGAELVPLDVDYLVKMADSIGNGDPFQAPRELARYLYTHSYNLSVTQLYNQVSHPSIKANSLANMKTRIDVATPQAWIQFLAVDRPAYIKAANDLFALQSVSALILPTYVVSAPPIDQSEPLVWLNGALRNRISLTSHSGTALQTAISVPIGLDAAGVPTGMQLIAPPGQDGYLMSLALAFEKALTAAGIVTPPPKAPTCKGCGHAIIAQTPTYNSSQTTIPPLGGAASVFRIEFNGTCAPDVLNYGKTPISQGLNAGPPGLLADAAIAKPVSASG